MSIQESRPRPSSSRLARVAAGILAVAMLSSLPVPAFAAGAKPPKTFCVDFTGVFTQWLVTTKAVGKGTTAAGTVALYDVTAAASYGAAWHGSGYMSGTTLHATLNTRAASYDYSIQLSWDTATSTGTSDYTATANDGTRSAFSTSLTSVDCSTITIAGAP